MPHDTEGATKATSVKLTKAQWNALSEIRRQGRASPYSARASVATFVALERRRLIVVETTLGAIAFPRNAQATITEAGRAALAKEKKDE